MPLIFVVTFGLAFKPATIGEVKVALVNYSPDSDVASDFIYYLKNATIEDLKVLSINNYSDEDASLRDLNREVVHAMIVIPDNFPPDYAVNFTEYECSVDITTLKTQPLTVGNIQLTLRNALSYVNAKYAEAQQEAYAIGGQTSSQTSSAGISANFSSKTPLGPGGFFTVSMPALIAYAFFFLFETAATLYASEREHGTMRRLLTTPVKSRDIILSGFISLSVIGVIQSGLLLVTAYAIGYIPAYPLGWVYAFFICVMVALCFIGFGLLISSQAKTKSQADTLVWILNVPMMFLTGFPFPVEFMPWYMQMFSKILPPTYAIHAMKSILVNGATLMDVSFDIAVLGALTAAFFVLGAIAFKKKM